MDNVNTEYELNVFSNSAGTVGQWYVDNVNEERRKDLSLLGDLSIVYGGTKAITGNIADTLLINLPKTSPVNIPPGMRILGKNPYYIEFAESVGGKK